MFGITKLPFTKRTLIYAPIAVTFILELHIYNYMENDNEKM